jgi:oxygen-dependent protoporphyrinogen oxidase
MDVSMSTTSQSFAIIGGGLTGLTAAWRLQREGHRVTVFERAPRVGGAITTHIQEGWLAEAGPNSLQETPEVTKLINELGLGRERLAASPAARNRYIVRGGRLVPAPRSPQSFLVSPLFSLRARFRVLREMLTRSRVRTTDLSLASFIGSHFGQEIVDYGLNPLIGGIYAGDPDKLSARYAFPNLWQLERRYGSLLRGRRAQAAERRARGESSGMVPVISFERGLQTLPAALAAALLTGEHGRAATAPVIRTGANVTSLIPGRPWKIVWNEGEAVHSAEFDAVLLAAPAPALSQLVFGTLGERPLASLDHLPHPPVSTVLLGFRREQVRHSLDGFGALVPAREQRSLLGVLFSSTLFHGRAPEGHVALTVFAGGMRQPDAARLPTPELLARVLPDLRDLLGITGDPVFTHHTFWPKAIPQYNVGHDRFLEPLTQCENRHNGLFIGGNARDGISLPDCIRSGQKLAGRAAEYTARL